MGWEITAVRISRGWSTKDPFKATVDVKYGSNKMEIEVDELRTLAIIEHVSDLIMNAVEQEMASFRDDAAMRVPAGRMIVDQTTTHDAAAISYEAGTSEAANVPTPAPKPTPDEDIPL